MPESEEELPHGYELVIEDDKIYIKFGAGFIVAKDTGQRKHVRGTDQAAQKRAVDWAWKFKEGWHSKNYAVETLQARYRREAEEAAWELEKLNRKQGKK